MASCSISSISRRHHHDHKKSEEMTRGRQSFLCDTSASHPCPLSYTPTRQLWNKVLQLWTNQISLAAKVLLPVHAQNMPPDGRHWQENPGEQRSVQSVLFLPFFPGLFLSLMFMDFISTQGVVLNSNEVFPSTLYHDSLILSTSLGFFKCFLFLIIKRGALLPGALCWHLWLPKR